jgi:hypothetical protein
VDATCAETERAIQGVNPPQSLGEFDEWVERLKPVLQRILNEQKALNPPGDLEDEWNAWIATGDDELDLLDELREAGAAEDSQRVQELLQEAEQRGLESEQLAESMGFRNCGVEGRRE